MGRQDRTGEIDRIGMRKDRRYVDRSWEGRTGQERANKDRSDARHYREAGLKTGYRSEVRRTRGGQEYAGKEGCMTGGDPDQYCSYAGPEQDRCKYCKCNNKLLTTTHYTSSFTVTDSCYALSFNRVSLYTLSFNRVLLHTLL